MTGARRVLVTGAGGFLGAPAVEVLRGRGWQVHGLGRRPRPDDDGVHWHAVDLLDAAAGRRVEQILDVAAPTHLLHLAWASGRDGFRDSPENYRWVGATLELLRRFAAAGGRRVVAVGTGAEYDWSGGECHETSTPLRPSSTYGLCKKATSELCARFLDQQADLAGAWARLFFLYGPREDDYRLLPSIVSALMRGEGASCTFDRLERDYLFVNDAARGLVDVLESDLEGPINVASGDAVPLGELVGRAAEQLGRRPLLQLGGEPRGEHPAPVVRADIGRLRRELDWRPRHTLDEALTITLDWWRRRRESDHG